MRVHHSAQVYAFISLFVVILSTVTFVLSTTPQLAPEMDLILFDIEEDNSTDTNNRAVERWEEVGSALVESAVAAVYRVEKRSAGRDDF